MWNFRLLALTGDARYADVLERALYNGANSGMSLSGTLYSVRNPLASNGEKLRNPWYDTTCWPPNIDRLLESLPGYFYSHQPRWGLREPLPQFGAGLASGGRHRPQDYSEHQLSLERRHQAHRRSRAFLRFHRLSQMARLGALGRSAGQRTTFSNRGSKRGSFIPISRTWNRGDVVTLNFPMSLTPMVANPRVADDYGRAAIQRGPLVYALEQLDQNGISLGDIFVRPSGPTSTEVRKDLLGGVTVLKVSGQAAEKSLGEEPLYQPLTTAAGRARRPIVLTFIPYYAIGNREPTPMEVWVPIAKFDGPSQFGCRHSGKTCRSQVGGSRVRRHRNV